ncbi:hypothetical protein D7V86_11730 [bacterium D16-51]|nr:hypothetical protein D7V96_13585 [bacterium D16-59]RKI59684.1 hypothetical protein D7V86_11730 [bacterium D16-51]
MPCGYPISSGGGKSAKADTVGAEVSLIPRADWSSPAAKQTLIDTTTATEAFNKAIVTVKCADDTNIGSWCSVHIVVTVNGKEEDIELKGTGIGTPGESCTIDLTGVSVAKNDTYKVEAYTDSYLGNYSGDFVYKVSIGDFSYIDTNNPEVSLIPRADWSSPAAKQTLIDTTTATEAFNSATVTVKCADDTNIGSWCSVHIVVTVNGKEEDIELKGTGVGTDGESCTIELTGISVAENDTYKIEAYTDSYLGNYSGDYVYKVSISDFTYKGENSEEPNPPVDDTLAEVQTSAWADEKKRAEIIPATTAESDYNKATVTVKCAGDVSFNDQSKLHIVITVNGVETDIEQEGIGGWDPGWSGTYDITDKFPVIKTGDTYKVEAYTDSWETHTASYVFKVGVTLVSEKTDDATPKPEKVKTEITSAKLSFAYEKAAEGTATFLKVCNVDVSGFAGNGTYEADIAEDAWKTWDKTGFYNLGFVDSDAGYTLKNAVLTVNGVYEFVLGETLSSEFKEEKHKVDFPNCWNTGYNAGDVLFTSKDGKATIVFGGNNVVISLYVESDKAPTPTATPTKKPNRPYYPVITPTPTPTAAPTAEPTATPSPEPTTEPTVEPTVKPTTAPTAEPTAEPTTAPTNAPIAEPTVTPAVPTEAPAEPTAAPVTPTKAPAQKVQKGDKVTVSGQKYVVTNASKKTVEYVAAKNSKKKTVSVPATVKVSVNGKKVTYKVTSIKNNAFKGNKKIEKITVSKNIKTIGNNAFKNCANLKTIVIKSTSLTKIGKDALKGTAKKLVIKVPAKKVSAYKKLFKNKGNNSIVIKKA